MDMLITGRSTQDAATVREYGSLDGSADGSEEGGVEGSMDGPHDSSIEGINERAFDVLWNQCQLRNLSHVYCNRLTIETFNYRLVALTTNYRATIGSARHSFNQFAQQFHPTVQNHQGTQHVHKPS